MTTTDSFPRLPSLRSLLPLAALLVVLGLVAARHALGDPRILVLLLATGVAGLVFRWAWPSLVVTALVAALEVRVGGHPLVAGWREEPLGPLAFGQAAALIAYLSSQLRAVAAAPGARDPGLGRSIALAPLWPALALVGLHLVPYRSWMSNSLRLPPGVVYFACVFLLGAAVALALGSFAGYYAIRRMEPRRASLAAREILRRELGDDWVRCTRSPGGTLGDRVRTFTSWVVSAATRGSAAGRREPRPDG